MQGRIGASILLIFVLLAKGYRLGAFLSLSDQVDRRALWRDGIWRRCCTTAGLRAQSWLVAVVYSLAARWCVVPLAR